MCITVTVGMRALRAAIVVVTLSTPNVSVAATHSVSETTKQTTAPTLPPIQGADPVVSVIPPTMKWGSGEWTTGDGEDTDLIDAMCEQWENVNWFRTGEGVAP
jgi:hypothetical protein